MKYSLGIKNITIYDPEAFALAVEREIFRPIIVPFRVEKDGTVLYTWLCQDWNNDNEMQMTFQHPNFTDVENIKLQSSPDEDSLDIVWETYDKDGNAFKNSVAKALKPWVDLTIHANTFTSTPTSMPIQPTFKLNWPWKKNSKETYFMTFDNNTNHHMIKVGCGYYNAEAKMVGFTLQLSNFPSTTQKMKKQKIEERKRQREEEVSGEDEKTDIDA